MSENKNSTPTPGTPKRSTYAHLLLLGFLVLAIGFWISSFAGKKSDAPKEVPYSEVLSLAQANSVTKAKFFSSGLVEAKTKDGKSIVSTVPTADTALIRQLAANGAEVRYETVTESSLLSFLLSLLPVLILVGASFYIFRRQTQLQNQIRSVGKSKTEPRETPVVTRFADVAGCEEAVREVAEIAEFLSNPGKFRKLGGRSPKGVLLSGPPGTGKTLLARAIAGEAGVPFLTAPGSGFVEMFVGVGASRVRDLFDRARALPACIVFIDEIDTVGRARGSGHGGGNDEREQTLNQLLVEMDGFDETTNIIVIAATNRPDVLDSALTRPGRFDRQVYVGLPDIRGREKILNIHLRKLPVKANVSVLDLARQTAGFSGADLGNLANEAALFAARRNGTHIEMKDFEDARDKVLMGPERRSQLMPEAERRNTAYHEAGHAIAAMALPSTDPVHKVTIIPRGRALGVTMQMPTEDRYSTDRQRLESTLAVLFAGRVAEELFVGPATTGASNDYERATAIARNMVTRWGYSDVLGPMVTADNNSDPTAGSSLSSATQREVDLEIRSLLRERYAAARDVLEKNRHKVEALAKLLLEKETVGQQELAEVMALENPAEHDSQES